MSAILDQLKLALEKGERAERQNKVLVDKVTQISQLAYTVNCIWLYSQDTEPSQDTLRKALPPLVSTEEGSIETALEYSRKTFIVVRSLLTGKIADLAKAEADLQSIQNTIAGVLANDQGPQTSSIPAIEEAEIEEIVDEVVPQPLTRRPKKDKGKAVARVKTTRPWILT